jgi:hypothetical protein
MLKINNLTCRSIYYPFYPSTNIWEVQILDREVRPDHNRNLDEFLQLGSTCRLFNTNKTDYKLLNINILRV